MTESEEPDQGDSRKPGVLVGNIAEPIKLSDLQLHGVSAEAGRGGDTIKVWTRLGLTSDDRLFHRAVEGIRNHIEYVAQQSGQAVNLKRAGFTLLVVHQDNTGEL